MNCWKCSCVMRFQHDYCCPSTWINYYLLWDYCLVWDDHLWEHFHDANKTEFCSVQKKVIAQHLNAVDSRSFFFLWCESGLHKNAIFFIITDGFTTNELIKSYICIFRHLWWNDARLAVLFDLSDANIGHNQPFQTDFFPSSSEIRILEFFYRNSKN